MDYEQIILHLLSSDYEVLPLNFGGLDWIQVNAQVAGKDIELLHLCVDEFTSLPTFSLRNPEQFGVLAHVLPIEKLGLAPICVNDPDSVSINYDMPELVFEEAIKRNVELLENAIGSPKWNTEELLREFKVNWHRLASNASETLMCGSMAGQFEKIDIYHPKIRDGYGIAKNYIGLSTCHNDQQINSYLLSKSSKKKTGAIGYIIPLTGLNPAPQSVAELSKWYADVIVKCTNSAEATLATHCRDRSNVFWLVFNGPTPSGTSWFGLKLSSKKKGALPLKFVDMAKWEIEKFNVDVFNRQLLMPRSGANPSLYFKSVLMVGCGSVGSELAMKLGAAGVGKIILVDDDNFSLANIYRHALSIHTVGYSKAQALAIDLKSRFPWLVAEGMNCKLLDLRTGNFATELLELYIGKNPFEIFDLIVVAIGSPTHERIFHDYLVEHKVKTPVINTWLEGYGIGGHAILDMPGAPGCLRCAYVENDTGARGLASNLNFFKQDQEIVKNYAGCGDTFIPYGAISSTQTALIAADLAVKCFEGKIKESKKVSWKGDSSDAEREKIALAPRYKEFNQSLQITPLYNPRCDVCRGEPAVCYKGAGVKVYISQDVIEQWQSFRQLEQSDVESAGLMIAHQVSDSVFWIDGITRPKPGDIQRRGYFKLNDFAHQYEVNQIHIESKQSRGYIGTWHTHPQGDPSPSSLDKEDWQQHAKQNPDRQLFFIIIGNKRNKCYTIKAGRLTKLKVME